MARDIVNYVDGRCNVCLVTHLKNSSEIINLTKYIGNNMIQLHSDIDEVEVEKIKNNLTSVKLVRLIHISKDGELFTNINDIKYVDYYLLDSFNLNTNQVGELV